MGAFDTVEKTIRDERVDSDGKPFWDKGEEVVIRELTYLEQSKIDKISLGGLTLGQTSDESRREQVLFGELATDKQGIAKMKACIVSWTFKKSGNLIPITEKTIGEMRVSYSAFINEQIEELNPTRDEEFQAESGNGAPDGDR